MHHGVTTPSIEKAALKRAAFAAAATTVLLTDSTRFGVFERFTVLPIASLKAVVTDSELDETAREALQTLSVGVLLADC